MSNRRSQTSLGERIKIAMEKRAMSQRQLEDISGVTQATISRVISGQTKEIRSGALRRFADALGVTTDYLVGRVDRMDPDDLVRSDPLARAIFDVYQELPQAKRVQLKEFAEFLYQQQGGELR